jgi:hypothetical protein
MGNHMPHGVFCDWLFFATKIVIVYSKFLLVLIIKKHKSFLQMLQEK